MNNGIPDIYNSLQEIAWHFGSHGINGECCDDLSFVEYMALKKVHGKNDPSIQEIGNALSFTKSGATRIINRLENKGYVTRKNSPTDGRVCCVSITAKGVEAVSRIMENYTAYLEGILKGSDPQKVDQIRNTLEMLAKAIQEKPFYSVSISHERGEWISS